MRPGSFLVRVARAVWTSPTGLPAVVALLILVLLAVVGPVLWSSAATRIDLTISGQPPSGAHPLGTDRLGRDIVARTLTATRLSLELAMIAAGLAAAIGFAFGALLATAPAHLRTLGLRVIEVLLAFPAILLAIFVTAIVGRGAQGAVTAIAIAFAPSLARVASNLAASVAGEEYVLAARVIGVGGRRLFLRYILPNISETLIVTLSFVVSSSLLAISALGFLGLGVQAPDFDWGRMLTEGVAALYVQPSAALAPAVAIAATGLTMGLIGESLARAMNPRIWTAARGRRRAVPRSSPPGMVLNPALVVSADEEERS